MKVRIKEAVRADVIRLSDGTRVSKSWTDVADDLEDEVVSSLYKGENPFEFEDAVADEVEAEEADEVVEEEDDEIIADEAVDTEDESDGTD